MKYNMGTNDLCDLVELKLSRYFGTALKDATNIQIYKAAAMTVRDILSSRRAEIKDKANAATAKRVYYMSIEFLLGRSLKNNLCNLGLEESFESLLKPLGISPDMIYDCESDAGLGNGGLGRLAACYMDSLASLGYPATGFSICYEYGLFKQMLVDGMQLELPDNWLPCGEVWLIPRTDKVYKVRMGGRVVERWNNGHLDIFIEDADEIEAVPYDMMISGTENKGVSINARMETKSEITRLTPIFFALPSRKNAITAVSISIYSTMY